MADIGMQRCSRCRWLYSLASECVIISLIIVHVLATTIEILVHLDLIHVPNQNISSTLSSGKGTTKAPPSQNTTSDGIFDPGGEKCDPTPIEDELVITIQVMRYTTMALSAIFLIEMIIKMAYNRKDFLKDPWQVFDLLVVIVSLGVEIAYYIEHDPLVCYSPVTEVAGYIILFRFWRIPRVCNIKKKSYARKLDNELVFLRKTKTDIDKKYQNLETLYEKQMMSLEKLYTMCWEHSEIQVEVEKILKCDEQDAVKNGNGPRKSFGNAINSVFKHSADPPIVVIEKLIHNKNLVNGYITGTDSKYTVHESPIKESPIKTSPIANGHTKKASKKDKSKKTKSKIESDSVHNSVDEGESDNIPKFALGSDKVDSAIDEVFMDSDASDTPVRRAATVQEVTVQIEEVSRQNQLPSVSRSMVEDSEGVTMRRDAEKFSGVVNEGYTGDGDTTEGTENKEDLDGSRTYKSAEGIPMTDL